MRFSLFAALIALVISFACLQGVDAKARLNRRRLGLEKRGPVAAGGTNQAGTTTNNSGVASGANVNPVAQVNGALTNAGTTLGTVGGVTTNVAGAQGIIGQTVTGTSTNAGGLTAILGGATGAFSGLSAPPPG